MAGDAELMGIRLDVLGTSLLALLLAALLDFTLRTIARRLERRARSRQPDVAEHEQRAQFWVGQGLQTALPQLSILIWTYAVHFTTTRLIAELLSADALGAVLPVLNWIRGAIMVVALVWLLMRIGRLIEERLRAAAVRTSNEWDDILLPLGGKAVRLILPLVAVILGAPALEVSPELRLIFRDATSLLIIGAVAVVLFQLVDAVEAFVLRTYRLDVRDNYRARAVHTQVLMLKRVAVVIIGLFTLASMLMVFDSVRQFGTTIIASAGVAGIVIGFAAQRSIATLLAGFQIALTQPIRLDDVVIVENEWGRIEEITLTYVVVHIWDMRRLIVPITYFIEKPFQNWTRTSAQILGSVLIYVDYDVPLEALRREFERVLQESTHWDGQVNVLQVTDAREHTIEVRALVSAVDSNQSWDLRCEIRERLIQFLHTNYPQSLPRSRVWLQHTATGREGVSKNHNIAT